VVKNTFKSQGFKLDKHENSAWDLYWADEEIENGVFSKIKPHQRINQYQGIEELSSKDKLFWNLRKLQKTFPEYFEFIPKTWVFPSDLVEFK
jgi:tubulin polyglutamylase TTLL7